MVHAPTRKTERSALFRTESGVQVSLLSFFRILLIIYAKQGRLRSAGTSVPTDLSPPCLSMPEYTFSFDMARLKNTLSLLKGLAILLSHISSAEYF